jgi:hypothetical protein
MRFLMPGDCEALVAAIAIDYTPSEVSEAEAGL